MTVDLRRYTDIYIVLLHKIKEKRLKFTKQLLSEVPQRTPDERLLSESPFFIIITDFRMRFGNQLHLKAPLLLCSEV